MFASAAISVICLILVIIFYFNHIAIKAQCWLMVGVGLGIGGMAGSILQQVGQSIADGVGAATSTVLGASVPWAIAIFVCTWFGIAVSKVGNDPNKWTLALGLFVPITLVMLPGNIGAAANTTLQAVGNSLSNLINMAL